MNRFKYRVPILKNGTFINYHYLKIGDKLPEALNSNIIKFLDVEQCTGLKDKKR